MQTIIKQNVTLSYKICLINYFKLFEMQPLIQKTNNKSNDVNGLWQYGNKLSPPPPPSPPLHSIASFTVQAVVFLRAGKLHKFGCFNSWPDHYRCCKNLCLLCLHKLVQKILNSEIPVELPVPKTAILVHVVRSVCSGRLGSVTSP